MEKARDAKGVPCGDGAGGMTPHERTQLAMATSTPDLPDVAGSVTCRLPDGRVGIVFHHKQNTGSCDSPDYTSTFYVHSKEGVEPHTAAGIRTLWKDVTGWQPIGREQKHLDQADDGTKSYVEAMRDIEALYQADVPVGGVGSRG